MTKLNERAGVTLIEAVISLALFSILMVMFVSMFVASNNMYARTISTDKSVEEAISSLNSTSAHSSTPISFSFSVKNSTGSTDSLSIKNYTCYIAEGKSDDGSIHLEKFVSVKDASAPSGGDA